MVAIASIAQAMAIVPTQEAPVNPPEAGFRAWEEGHGKAEGPAGSWALVELPETYLRSKERCNRIIGVNSEEDTRLPTTSIFMKQLNVKSI